MNKSVFTFECTPTWSITRENLKWEKKNSLSKRFPKGVLEINFRKSCKPGGWRLCLQNECLTRLVYEFCESFCSKTVRQHACIQLSRSINIIISLIYARKHVAQVLKGLGTGSMQPVWRKTKKTFTHTVNDKALSSCTKHVVSNIIILSIC